MTSAERSMRISLAAVLAWAALAGIAQAQTRGYAEAVAQSAFGTVTSQSYGAEVGATISGNVQLFVEGGQIRNVATAQISDGAQRVAGALTQLQSAAVSWSVRQPVTFGVAGIRYLFPATSPRVRPYVLAGAGAARVENDVAFQFGGNDASGVLAQYVTLGTDLSGRSTSAMITAGAGLAWAALPRLVIDFQYRYGRILAEDAGIDTNRAGIGIGVRF